MGSHFVPDVPVYPNTNIMDTWASTCHCGYGLIGDSPEVVILAMAIHIFEALPEDAPERQAYDLRRL